MDALFRRRRTPAAFTLVEMLTVIVIIGILAGLITVAARAVQIAATRSVVLMQITELGRALEAYKAEVGAYPPDFTGVNRNDAVGVAARARVIAHLRKAFPKYRPIGDGTASWNDWDKFCYDVSFRYSNLNINPANFDASAGLVFWLGGLPERNTRGDWNKPAGFHSDSRMPFKPGLPRTDPPFKFAPDDLLFGTDALALGTNIVQFCPKRLREKAPVVYFRSYRSVSGRFEYGQDDGVNPFEPKFYAWNGPLGFSYCVPYLESQSNYLDLNDRTLKRRWRNLETYQILCAGFDSEFGESFPAPVPLTPGLAFRCTKSGYGFTQGDFDNLTNFYTAGDLEGELQ